MLKTAAPLISDKEFIMPKASSRTNILAFALLAAFVLQPVTARAAATYHLTGKIAVPGAGGWDYLIVDDAARRVYVSHGVSVDILDADSGKIVGRISDLQGVHGIALAPDLGRGFISDGRADTVIAFDLKTLKKLAAIKTGKNPDAIVYEPVTHRVFSFNGGSGDATVIDAAQNKVVGTIDLGGKPEFATVDGAGHVFDNLEDKSQIVKIDADKQTITDRWPLAPGESPSSLAIDQKNHRLFAGCHNQKLIVLNADNGKLISAVPIGQGVDATVFDPETALIVASNGEGTLTVIHQDNPDQYGVQDTVKTQEKSRTLALDRKTHRLFVPAAQFGAAPAPTKDNPHGRPAVIPGSFSVLLFDR
jgi:YVTN family beta-propeller protein